MSWFDLRSRLTTRHVLAGAMVLALGACFRPVYGPTASGVRVQDSLAAIKVANITTQQGQERLGHFIRSELVFDLDGSGRTQAKKYELTIRAAESVLIASTDSLTGRADVATLNVTASYRLTSLDGKKELNAGTVRASATYFRDPQRFASLRAVRDAEIRAAKQVSDDLKQRLAAMFATSP